MLVVTHNNDFLRQSDLIVHLNPDGRTVGAPDEFFRQNTSFNHNGDQIEATDTTELVDHSAESSLGSTIPPFDAVEYVQEVVPEEGMERGTVKGDVYWFYMVGNCSEHVCTTYFREPWDSVSQL